MPHSEPTNKPSPVIPNGNTKHGPTTNIEVAEVGCYANPIDTSPYSSVVANMKPIKPHTRSSSRDTKNNEQSANLCDIINQLRVLPNDQSAAGITQTIK